MNHSIKKIFTFFSLCNFALVIPSPTFANHSWGSYHWARTSNPFTLRIGDNLKPTSTTTTPWTELLIRTINDWNNNGNYLDPLRSSRVSGTAGKNCSAVSGTTQVCNKTYGNNGWLGLATIWLNGTHITQGVAKLNDTYFNSSYYNNENEKLHVMCQEVAHTFGLDHQSTDGSSQNTCMDYFSNTGGNAGSSQSTKPNAHDFDELNKIYTHTDSLNTFTTSSATAKMLPNVVDDPRSWGNLIRQSQNGRSSIYENYLGGGRRIATHVTWTEEKAAQCPKCDHRFH